MFRMTVYFRFYGMNFFGRQKFFHLKLFKLNHDEHEYSYLYKHVLDHWFDYNILYHSVGEEIMTVITIQCTNEHLLSKELFITKIISSRYQ